MLRTEGVAVGDDGPSPEGREEEGDEGEPPHYLILHAVTVVGAAEGGDERV